MKNIKYILLSLIALTLLFAACTDLSKDSSGSQEKTEYTLVGSLSLAGVSRAAYSRTATSSFSDELIWTITAKKGDKTYLPKEMSDTSFSFAFEETGEYTIEAKALKDGQAIAQGSTSCTVSKGGDNFAQIIATPHACTIPGSVNLVINLDTVAADNVASVYVEWYGLNSTADELNKSFDVVNGKATITFDDISCGAHNVNLSFNDSIGNTLYSSPEIINVYSGFTTDTWYGTSPYLNGGTFTLTNALLTKYDAERVPNTKIVLYGPAGEYGNLSYYLVDSSTETITDDTPATVETDLSGTSFVFDSKGYFYTFAKLTESAIFIKSTKPDFGSKTHDNSYYPGAMYLDVNYGSCMTIDRVNDFLYFLDTGSGAIFQITGDDGEYIFKSSNAYDSAKNYSFTNDTNRNIIQSANTFAIYDRVAYFGSRNYTDSTLHLVIADLKNAAPGDSDNNYLVDGSKDIDLGAADMGLSSDAIFTDMLYQDGCIYMLVTDTYENLSNEGAGVLQGTFNNRGTVIKYDIYSGAVDNIPLEDTTSSVEKLYIIGRPSSGGDYKPLERYYDGNDANTTYSPLIYDATKYTNASITVCPQILEDPTANVLYSPKKFIAIKPKKLIIADDGIAYYVDSLGGLRYKNENRVVEVDLESFAISKVESANVSFTGDNEDDIVITSGGGLNGLFSGTYYVSDSTSASGYSQSPGGNYFAGIFSEED